MAMCLTLAPKGEARASGISLRSIECRWTLTATKAERISESIGPAKSFGGSLERETGTGTECTTGRLNWPNSQDVTRSAFQLRMKQVRI
jgi:hypothetical protein